MASKKPKKIAEWEYVPKSGGKMMVSVYMTATYKCSYSSKEIPTTFSVNLPQYKIEASNTDIDALKKEVFALLDDRIEIKWENFLRVTVIKKSTPLYETRKPWRAGESETIIYNSHAEAELELAYSRLQLAKTPTGAKLHRYPDQRSYYDKGNSVNDGWPQDQRSVDLHRHRHEVIVPDTPEMRAALDKIHNGIDAIAIWLETLLEFNSQGAALLQLGQTALPQLMQAADPQTVTTDPEAGGAA